MFQNEDSSYRLPIVILGDSGPNQESSLPERVLKSFQRDQVGIIEHGVSNGIPSDCQSVPCAQQVRWLNDRYSCFSLKGDAVELLQQLAQRLHDGELLVGGVVITTATAHDPSELHRILCENELISACFYIDTVAGTRDLELHAQDGGLEDQEQDIVMDGDAQMASNPLEFEQAQLLMSRLRAGTALAGNGLSAEIDRTVASQEANAAAISSSESELTPGAHNSHENDIGSFVFRSYRPFQFERLGNFMATTLKTYGDNLLHYKGVLYFSGCANRVLFKGSGLRMTSEAGPEWAMTEARENTMIFVGRGLPRETLTAGLNQCLADVEQAG